MEFTEQQLKDSLVHINELVENGLADEACNKYIMLTKTIENDDTIDKNLKAQVYGSFAYFLFNASAYEESIIMFKNAQYYGYSKDEIKALIFNAFIEPNITEFKNNYEKNIQLLLSNGYKFIAIKFDDLPFWLIPTTVENEYFIYDKLDTCIKDKFSINADFVKSLTYPVSDEFGDFLMLEEWDFSKIYPYIKAVKEKGKKSYIVIGDFAKFLSCFQGEELKEEQLSEIIVFNGFENMKHYFKDSSEYLPRNTIDLMAKRVESEETIEEVHKYRISKEGRKGNNILISVCIPSYNRGNRAYDNIIHNLKSYYDEEIEFVVSNNGTKNNTCDYYNMISELEDSRVNYFNFEENQGVAINICKVCEMAKGKYILLLSDEDLINFTNFHKVINILNNMKETLAILKTAGDIQATILTERLAKAGRDAILTYMLSSNYLSGIIFNNKLLKEYNITQHIRNNIDISVYFYYPHVIMELLLCQYGDVKGENIVLINEGKAEITEVPRKEIGEKNKVSITKYASIEGRLEQHKDFLNIFRELEVSKNDFITLREMYTNLCFKTLLLVCVSINEYYKKADNDISKILENTYDQCIKYLDEVYGPRKDKDKKYYCSDLDKIKTYYKLFRENIL